MHFKKCLADFNTTSELETTQRFGKVQPSPVIKCLKSKKINYYNMYSVAPVNNLFSWLQDESGTRYTKMKKETNLYDATVQS